MVDVSLTKERFPIKLSYGLLLHLLLILVVALFTYWEMTDIYQKDSRWFPTVKSSAIILLVVYLNIYLLAPQLLLKRRWYWVYMLTVLYIVLLVYFVEMRLNSVVNLNYTLKIRELFGKIEINPLLQIFTSIFSLVILMISSSAIILFREWDKHEVRVHHLEKVAIQMELEQLKKQVNPQLLVRMLDVANSLTLQGKRDEAAHLLLNLGNILRYQLYDSARKYVLLNSDIHFLTEILSLEKHFRTDFSFSVETGDNMQNYLIPPLLFLPFVEYVISDNRNFIGLYFRVEDDVLLFECQSPYASNPNETNPPSNEFTGICRRLTLLYQAGYSLETKHEHDMQIIRLRILHPEKHYESIVSPA